MPSKDTNEERGMYSMSSNLEIQIKSWQNFLALFLHSYQGVLEAKYGSGFVFHFVDGMFYNFKEQAPTDGDHT